MPPTCYINCSLDDLRNLELKTLQHCRIYAKDKRIKYRNYVFGLCLQISAFNNPIRVENITQSKIRLPRHSILFSYSKIYRLAHIIHESTRILADYYSFLSLGDITDFSQGYHSVNFIRAIGLALKLKYFSTEDFDSLDCWNNHSPRKCLHQSVDFKMSLFIVDRFWNSSVLYSSLFKLPQEIQSCENDEPSVRLFVDTISFLQIIFAFFVLRLVFAKVFRVRI